MSQDSMKNSSGAAGETPAVKPSWWRKRLNIGQDDIANDLWQLLYLYRWRIGVALGFLLLAKVAMVSVPLILKRIIDEFSRPEQLPMLPVYLLVGYALVRFSSTLFNELRDMLFSRVTQSTVAIYARKAFSHLHTLGARFHSQRRMGGLLPEIDRGTSGIAFLLGAGLFTLVPILVEIGMVLGIMLAKYSGWFAAIIAILFLTYSSFTL
ncbi:MAG TPA: ABC transporter transmembrane domain-containing protein, partial [Methylophilaceae bacterium]|nr:ABC transporter transmembrane domain-containing protein [Methylophilaceae bacterium]